jgi:hypothetical protein
VFTSPNDVSCNDVLIVNENMMLKEMVEKLTNDLARCYIGCRGGSWHPRDRACMVNWPKMHQDRRGISAKEDGQSCAEIEHSRG